jgi:ureidoglycolate hydrolase
MKVEFSRESFEKYSNIMKIRPMGAEVFHVDGETDKHNQVSHNSANVSKTSKLMLYTGKKIDVGLVVHTTHRNALCG